jgi:hypothetical protein
MSQFYHLCQAKPSGALILAYHRQNGRANPLHVPAGARGWPGRLALIQVPFVVHKDPGRYAKISRNIVPDSSPDENPLPRLIDPLGGPALAYTFLRHTGFLLDELCAEGLLLWLDENGRFDRIRAGRWQWHWQTASLQSSQGFWAMGEALVDTVAACYPTAFALAPNEFSV